MTSLFARITSIVQHSSWASGSRNRFSPKMCGESNFCSVNSSMSLWSDLYSNTSSGSEEFFLESSVECMRPSSFFKNINMDFSWSRDAPPLDDTLPLDLSVKKDHNYNQYHAFGLPPIKSILRYDGPLSQVPYSGWKTEELSGMITSQFPNKCFYLTILQFRHQQLKGSGFSASQSTSRVRTVLTLSLLDSSSVGATQRKSAEETLPLPFVPLEGNSDRVP